MWIMASRIPKAVFLVLALVAGPEGVLGQKSQTQKRRDSGECGYIGNYLIKASHYGCSPSLFGSLKMCVDYYMCKCHFDLPTEVNTTICCPQKCPEVVIHNLTLEGDEDWAACNTWF